MLLRLVFAEQLAVQYLLLIRQGLHQRSWLLFLCLLLGRFH